MKRIVLVIMLSLLSFIVNACHITDKITIITPAGSTQLAQLYLQNDKDNYDVTVVDGPSPLQAAFGSKGYDVIFAPTNLGAKMYNLNSEDYQLLASIVWGNYYFVTKNPDVQEFSDLDNQNVLLFGENSTSDYICQFLFAKNNIMPRISYVNSVLVARNALLADNNAIVLLAEPHVSIVKISIANLKIFDVQALYETATKKAHYPQSSVFVRADLPESTIAKIRNDLEKSIKQVNDNLDMTVNLAVSLDLGFEREVLLSAIPLSNLDYRSGVIAKKAIEDYFNILMEFDTDIIGGYLPKDQFYR